MAITYVASLVARQLALLPPDPPTFSEICNILPTNLTWSQRLFEPGLLEITTQVSTLDPVGKARLRDLPNNPSEVWLYRTDTSTGETDLVHAGPVTAWRIVNRAITITCPDLLYYLRYMKYANTVTITDDLSSIVQQLCEGTDSLQWFAGIYSGDLTPTGVTSTVNYSISEPVTLLEAAQTLGRSTNGFDLWVDPVPFDAGPNTIKRSLVTYIPQRGVDLSADVVIDLRSIGEADIAYSIAADEFATVVYAGTSTVDSGPLWSQQSDIALVETFGLAGKVAVADNVANQTALDDLASAALRDFKIPHLELNPEILPVFGFDPITISPGDTIGYSYDAGLGMQQTTLRVASIDTRWNGRERMSLGFV